MKKVLFATKLNMTRTFLTDGTAVPVTALKADPAIVTQIKNQDKDGYASVQLGTGTRRKVTQAVKGHLKASGLETVRHLHEFKMDSSTLTVGQKLDLSQFAVGDMVYVQGISKGRGFQGVVKRHGFHGHPTTHGHKDQARMPGSIGAGGKQHVLKGMRMAGHMGTDKITVHNLEVMEINTEKNEILVKGAVPGARGGLVYLISEKE